MKYVLYKDKRKEWRWRLLSANGRIIASSAGDGYKRRIDCVTMIKLIERGHFSIIDTTKKGMRRIVRDDV